MFIQTGIVAAVFCNSVRSPVKSMGGAGIALNREVIPKLMELILNIGGCIPALETTMIILSSELSGYDVPLPEFDVVEWYNGVAAQHYQLNCQGLTFHYQSLMLSTGTIEFQGNTIQGCCKKPYISMHLFLV